MPTGQNINEVKIWLLKELDGTISQEEKAQLEAWKKESTANEELAQRIHSAQFLRKAILDSNKQIRQKQWNALWKEIGYTRFPRIEWHKTTRIAAVIALLIACGWMFVYYLQLREEDRLANITIPAGSTKAILYDYANDSVCNLPETAGYVFELDSYNRLASIPKDKMNAATHRSIVVPRGGEYKIRLTDSTFIHLGPESTLDIPICYSPQNRNIRISGQAYLAVHKDASHPFIIETPHTHIRVTGTRLNVEAYPDEPQAWVALEEGKVELLAGNNSMKLPVGRTAAIDSDSRIILTPDSLIEHTAWHNDRMVFYNRSIEEIMKHFSRWYNIDIGFKNKEARQSRITMDVNKYDTFNQLKEDIERMNELQIKIKRGNRVLISERNLE